jgi:hypothetical protein
MLVLTGVTAPADLLLAPPPQRPTYLARSVRGLLDRQPAPVRDGDAWSCGGWRVGPGLRRTGSGDDLDALRALCAAAWAPAAAATDPDTARAAVRGLDL